MAGIYLALFTAYVWLGCYLDLSPTWYLLWKGIPFRSGKGWLWEPWKKLVTNKTVLLTHRGAFWTELAIILISPTKWEALLGFNLMKPHIHMIIHIVQWLAFHQNTGSFFCVSYTGLVVEMRH